ncbi:MAG: hypothetical protein AB1505_02195 [Candidatus Latescibacterota bacterium]
MVPYEPLFLEPLPSPSAPSSLRPPPGSGARSPEYTAPRDPLPSLEDVERHAAPRRALALSRYRRPPLPDADTTDAESHRRRRAEAIVDQAIQAMGGAKAMSRVRRGRTAVQVWNGKRRRWETVEVRQHADGRRFARSLGRGRQEGFDGQHAWSYYYGMPLPAWQWGLQRQAERWDFLSRFRGEGVLLSYDGVEALDEGRVAHAIRVEDLKYGGTVEAYVDVQTQLLVAIREGVTTTDVVSYQRTAGVLAQRELWVQQGKFLTRLRHETRYEVPDEPARFADPGPRTWDAGAMAALLQVDQNSADLPTLEVDMVHQQITEYGPDGRPRDVIADPLTLQLLRFYLSQKLRAAGILSERGGDCRVDVRIKGYFEVPQPPPDPPVYDINLFLTVYDQTLRERRAADAVVWGDRVHERWGGFGIDGAIADRLTLRLVESLGHGLAQARLAAREPALQAAEPSADPVPASAPAR